MTKPQSFGEQIRLMRLKLKLTQKVVSEKLGLPLRSWQDWEYGISKPDDFKAQAVLNALKNLDKTTP